MLELGIDLPVSQPGDLSILLNGEELFSYLITVCDTGSLKRCPVFPGKVSRLHWNFPDPDIEGTLEDKLEATRDVRDGIRVAVVEFIGENT
jgi:arsenate reductase